MIKEILCTMVQNCDAVRYSSNEHQFFFELGQARASLFVKDSENISVRFTNRDSHASCVWVTIGSLLENEPLISLIYKKNNQFKNPGLPQSVIDQVLNILKDPNPSIVEDNLGQKSITAGSVEILWSDFLDMHQNKGQKAVLEPLLIKARLLKALAENNTVNNTDNKLIKIFIPTYQSSLYPLVQSVIDTKRKLQEVSELNELIENFPDFAVLCQKHQLESEVISNTPAQVHKL